MCTAGFWKDKKGNIHYFKNRNLPKMPKNQYLDLSKKGIFIRDENGKFEGMNKYGLFFVGLTLKSKVSFKGKKNHPNYSLSEYVLTRFKTAKKALNYLIKECEKYDCSFTKILGDGKNVFLIEVSSTGFAYADLTNAPFFVATNHGQLLIEEGYSEDENNYSHLRLKEAQSLLKKAQEYDDLKAVLCSHKNGKIKNAICCHGRSLTVSAYLFTPYELKAEICMNGQPCEKGFKLYSCRF